jgi:hypothetical protein
MKGLRIQIYSERKRLQSGQKYNEKPSPSTHVRRNPNTTIKPSTGLLSPVSPVSNWPSPPHTTSSISTSPHEAYTPLNNESCNSFDNSFENTTQWGMLGSSAVNTFGDATLGLPPSAVPPTWDNGWMPEADPQRRLYLSVPLSVIQDELAIDEEQGDSGTLLRPSHVPTTWQNLTLIPSTVRSHHKPASGGPKRSRRSSRNSNSTTTCARKHSSLAKTSDKDRRRLFASHQRSPTSRQLRTTKPSDPPNQTTFPSASTDISKGNNRTSHNLVEKKYRTRLNGLFAALLSTIPKDVIAADVNGYTKGC